MCHIILSSRVRVYVVKHTRTYSNAEPIYEGARKSKGGNRDGRRNVGKMRRRSDVLLRGTGRSQHGRSRRVRRNQQQSLVIRNRTIQHYTSSQKTLNNV